MNWWEKIQKNRLLLLSTWKGSSIINKITASAFAITIVGVVITIFAMYKSCSDMNESSKILRSASQEIDTTRHKIDTVLTSVNTRYIGVFPDFINHVNTLLSEAENKIIIFEDVLSYGMFSCPEQFHETISILRSQLYDNKKPMKVYFVIYNSDLCKEKDVEQWLGIRLNIDRLSNEKREERFQKTISGNIAEFQAKYDKFVNYDFSEEKDKVSSFEDLQQIKKQNLPDSITFLTYKNFTTTLEEMRKILFSTFEKAGKRRCEIIESPTRHIMHCWLIDNRQIIYSFPTQDGGVTEIAFRSQDHAIISLINQKLEEHKRIIISN